MAGGRSGRRDTRGLRHQDEGQGRGAQVHEEAREAPRLTRGDHHGWVTLLAGRDERAGQDREARDLAADFSTAKRGDAEHESLLEKGPCSGFDK